MFINSDYALGLIDRASETLVDFLRDLLPHHSTQTHQRDARRALAQARAERDAYFIPRIRAVQEKPVVHSRNLTRDLIRLEQARRERDLVFFPRIRAVEGKSTESDSAYSHSDETRSGEATA